MSKAAVENNGYKLPDVILRAYDIRGIVGETLSADDAFHIGKAFATYVSKNLGKDKPKLSVARDGRLSSPELEQAIADGIKSTGAEVIRVGLGPTPMLYFSVFDKDLDGGVMVTGSHNPPTHNGFKFMIGKKALFGEQIKELGAISEAGDFLESEGSETLEDIKEKYLEKLLTGLEAEKELKIAWDAGNGAAGEIMKKIAKKIPGEYILLNEDIDGNFPAHHPDPSKEENLQELISAINEENCDIGLAFDGDGDRVGVVDDMGRVVTGDHLMMLYAADVLESNKGATVIADVKASQGLFDEIAKLGGKPVIWKTGHSFIKSKMAETGAELAGEMSGHIFFADRYFGFDDGIYAAIRILNILAKSDKKLSELIDALPKAVNTPEMRIPCPEERKFEVIEEVKQRLNEEGADFSDIDGVRVMSEDGWWLLRASNTGAEIVGRCEGKNENSLKKIKKIFEGHLNSSGISI